MAVEKLKNPFNSFSEIVKKINEIIDNIGGGGGGGFTPTQQQLDAMNSGATVAKINQIATNQANIQNVNTNKVDKEVGKQLIPDAELAQITLNKTDLTFLKQPTESSNDPTDSSLVSSIDNNAKNTTFSFEQIFNWMKGKITSVYYPVGTVIFNTGTNPGTTFGGTWSLYATGTKALYLDATAGTTVNEELPDPSITLSSTGKKTVDFKGAKGFAYKSGGKADTWGMDYGTHELYEQATFDSVETASNHRHTVTIGNSVYKSSGKVRAEGITICAWKRTA